MTRGQGLVRRGRKSRIGNRKFRTRWLLGNRREATQGRRHRLSPCALSAAANRSRSAGVISRIRPRLWIIVSPRRAGFHLHRRGRNIFRASSGASKPKSISRRCLARWVAWLARKKMAIKRGEARQFPAGAGLAYPAHHGCLKFQCRWPAWRHQHRPERGLGEARPGKEGANTRSSAPNRVTSAKSSTCHQRRRRHHRPSLVDLTSARGHLGSAAVRRARLSAPRLNNGEVIVALSNLKWRSQVVRHHKYAGRKIACGHSGRSMAETDDGRARCGPARRPRRGRQAIRWSSRSRVDQGRLERPKPIPEDCVVKVSSHHGRYALDALAAFCGASSSSWSAQIPLPRREAATLKASVEACGWR